MGDQVINDAELYGVSIEPADVGLGKAYWRIKRLHHLTPEENGGNHHIYCDLVSERGEPIVGGTLRVTWPGGAEEVTTQDKEHDQPGANFPISVGQMCAVEALGAPSERAVGLHAEHPDEGAGNTLYHHSFYVVWQRTLKKVFSHYVLFGPPEDSQTQADLIIAMGYILRFKPAFGFKVQEAELAERVTIIGGTEAVSLDDQDVLEEAGCWVHRIEGDSRSVDRVLNELQKGGHPFPQ
jgi:hypothetical protein